jgi:hypothetical protein
MKSKKMLIIAALFCAFMCLSTTANAAWYVCTVNETGVSTSGNIMFVSLSYVSDDGSGTSWTGMRWYIIAGDYDKAGLATALSALASGAKVSVAMASSAAWTTIEGIFMRND